jgi:hypothetical protein
MDKTTEVDQLITSCRELLHKLQAIDPNHGLCVFALGEQDMDIWEELTAHFYNHFLDTYKPWRKRTQSEILEAWRNFQGELEAALAISQAKRP